MVLRYRKMVFMILASAVAAAGLSACGGGDVQKEARELSPEELKTASYPLETDETLTMWMRHHVGAQVPGQPDYSKSPRVAEGEKQIGVRLSITYADNGQEEEQFNLLLASGNLPDMIYYDWLHVTGGADEAIRSGYITALNGLIADYAPNYCKFLEEKPEYAKMARTDSGNYYMFNGYPGADQEKINDLERSAVCGLAIRKDWLEELGLEPPETIAEWYTVLKAFRDQKGVKAPMTFNFSDEYAYQNLIGAYGIAPGFYQEDGHVLYGRVQPAYRDFLSEMRKWYAEGLLDEGIMSASDERVTEKMVEGTSGASFTWIGAGIERWLKEGKALDPDYDLLGLRPPTLQKGETSKFGNYFSPFPHIGIAISATSEKKELAAKFLDYGYSDPGAVMYNYGVEGVSYEMKDGKPTYKEQPEGMTRSDFLTLYTSSTGNWPYKVLTTGKEFFYRLPQQFQAVEAYMHTEYPSYLMPPISQTVDEAEEASRLERLVLTYADEMMRKFILGREPLENYDLYVEQMRSLGIDRLTELKQEALDRYNRR